MELIVIKIIKLSKNTVSKFKKHYLKDIKTLHKRIIIDKKHWLKVYFKINIIVSNRIQNKKDIRFIKIIRLIDKNLHKFKKLIRRTQDIRIESNKKNKKTLKNNIIKFSTNLKVNNRVG